jgi:hypothetical protein
MFLGKVFFEATTMDDKELRERVRWFAAKYDLDEEQTNILFSQFASVRQHITDIFDPDYRHPLYELFRDKEQEKAVIKQLHKDGLLVKIDD